MAIPIPIIGSVIDGVIDIVKRLIPDKEKALELEVSIRQQAMTQDFQERMGQVAINTEEAKSSSWFVAGWRPAVGWVCAAALAYHYILQPFINYAISVADPAWQAPPSIEMADLMYLLTGMLGFGALRSWEKTKGVSK